MTMEEKQMRHYQSFVGLVVPAVPTQNSTLHIVSYSEERNEFTVCCADETGVYLKFDRTPAQLVTCFHLPKDVLEHLFDVDYMNRSHTSPYTASQNETLIAADFCFDHQYDEAACEALIEVISKEFNSDDEPWYKKGRALMQAFIDHDVEGCLMALTGWTMHSLLVRAGIAPDSSGIIQNGGAV